MPFTALRYSQITKNGPAPPAAAAPTPPHGPSHPYDMTEDSSNGDSQNLPGGPPVNYGSGMADGIDPVPNDEDNGPTFFTTPPDDQNQATPDMEKAVILAPVHEYLHTGRAVVRVQQLDLRKSPMAPVITPIT